MEAGEGEDIVAVSAKRLDPATAASCARRARERSASREGGARRRQRTGGRVTGWVGAFAPRRRRLGTHPQLLAARARVRRQARTSEPVSVIALHITQRDGCFAPGCPSRLLPQIRRSSSSSLSWEMEPQPLTGARYAQRSKGVSAARSLAPNTAPVGSADATSHSALTRAHRRAIRLGG